MLFDPNAFMNLVEKDTSLAKSLLELFKGDWPPLFAELEEAFRLGQAAEVEKVAHRLKGSARIFFAHATSDLASEFEEAGRNQNLTAASPRLPELKTHLERLQTELEEYFKTL